MMDDQNSGHPYNTDLPATIDDFCEFFRGEIVRLRMFPKVTGQVVGERNWGDEYLVRIGMGEQWFRDVELETVEPEPDPDGEASTGGNGGGNVIDLAEVRARGAA